MMTEKRYKILRNIFILIGIVGGFVIWLFVPTVIRNDAFIHVGNGPYGLKYGYLVILLIPLCALIPVTEPHNGALSFHSDDVELINRVRKKTAQIQMLTAFVTSGLALIIMTVGLFR